MAVKLSPSALAKCSITPPHLNRQHSYSTRPDTNRSTTSNATAVLASVASRATSPGRKSPHTTPLASPTEAPQAARRTSWEDCRLNHDGYISFPDFDQLRENQEKAP